MEFFAILATNAGKRLSIKGNANQISSQSRPEQRPVGEFNPQSTNMNIITGKYKWYLLF